MSPFREQEINFILSQSDICFLEIEQAVEAVPEGTPEIHNLVTKEYLLEERLSTVE